MKNPPDRETLERIVAILEDPVADLVRKDSQFQKLGLDEADYTEPGPVVDLLVARKALMQRPVIVKGDVAAGQARLARSRASILAVRSTGEG